MQSLKKIVLTASVLMCAGTVAFAGELDTQQAKEFLTDSEKSCIF